MPQRATWAVSLGVLLVAVLSLGACSGGDDKPLYEPWKLGEWLTFGSRHFEAAPPEWNEATGDPLDWYHHVTGYGSVAVDEGWAGLDRLAGEGSLAGLRAMDTPALRTRYAEGLTDYHEVRDRIRTSSTTPYPVTFFTVAIRHWSEESPHNEIEAPSLHLPVGGAVMLPVGSDPAIDENPELAALVAELQRVHEAWAAYTKAR